MLYDSIVDCKTIFLNLIIQKVQRINVTLTVRYIQISILFFLTSFLYSQEEEKKIDFSGAYQGTFNYFIKDVRIGAANIPQYEGNPFGNDSWLNLNASYGTLNAGIRLDLFYNSNLLNPTSSYSDYGLGIWFLEKEFKKLTLKAGAIYDQIGSGIIYRAYEQRPLLIDNALKGVQADYQFSDNWNATIFTGMQRYLFSSYEDQISGIKVEGFFSKGKTNPISFSPGVGMVVRSLSETSRGQLISVLRNYIGEERVNRFPYDTYALSLYNTLSWKTFSWYFEGAYKFPEVFFDPDATTTKITGAVAQGRYVKEAGSVLYSTFSYGQKGIGITLEAKRTENFDFRADPTLTLINGLINFLPPMNHLTTYRLTSRYNPATQFTSELAFQLDINWKLGKKNTLNINASNITTLENELLYREVYVDLMNKPNRKLQSHFGIQSQWYNQAIYEGKPKSITPMLWTLTPFMDVLYKINRKNSIRIESQFMYTEQDYGSWFYLLAEYGLVPHWRFELSGMYNIFPNSDNPNIPEGAGGKILYPTAGVVYQDGSSRYSLRYVKQVEGVVCTGGICRLEPAFSGIKFEVYRPF